MTVVYWSLIVDFDAGRALSGCHLTAAEAEHPACNWSSLCLSVGFPLVEGAARRTLAGYDLR